MRCVLLFSGGKDSALAALVLEPLVDVTLVTVHLGVGDATEPARRAAAALGLPFAAVALDRSIAEAAVEEMVADGYPRAGIQRVHEAALEAVAGGTGTLGEPDGGDGADAGERRAFDAVADGTRRDDRVPTVSRADARSLEDRHGVDYLRPLAGFGRGAVDRLASDLLAVESGPSEELSAADYEVELRALLADRRGDAAVAEVFPPHTQTRVVGRRG